MRTFVAALAAVLFLCGVYKGSTIPPDYKFISWLFEHIFFSYILTVVVAWFVILPFGQIWSRSGQFDFPYTDLFEHSWNNALELVIASAFCMIFWCLLWLWGALFKVIDIDFFADLFSENYFIYPVTATVFGFALVLSFARRTAVITLRGIVLAIFRALLPLLAVIALLFLCALPIAGLQPLWDTGYATALMLTLQILMIVFINAVYQDGAGPPPYPVWLRRVIQLALLVLPIYSALCCYALSLRIDQYGWSVDRVWAVVLTLVTGLYAFTYALAALPRGSHWLGLMNPVNVGMSLVVVVIALAVNTPALDPKSITMTSQMSRLMQSKTPPDEFDYALFRFELGRLGQATLRELSRLTDHPQAELIRSNATAALAMENRWAKLKGQPPKSTAQLAEFLDSYPEGKVVDSQLQHFLLTTRELEINELCSPIKQCLLLAIDLDRDNREEYVLLRAGFGQAQVFAHISEGWRRIGYLSKSFFIEEEMLAALQKNKVKALATHWDNLQIGKQIYAIVPEKPLPFEADVRLLVPDSSP